MFLLYLSVCTICILKTSAYVLIAANVDDFKSLAKKFIPDKLTEEILAGRDMKPEGEADEKSEEETPRTKVRLNNSSVFELNLDDLVEKVKQRLGKELSVLVTKFTKNPTDKAYSTIGITAEEETVQSRYKKLQSSTTQTAKKQLKHEEYDEDTWYMKNKPKETTKPNVIRRKTSPKISTTDDKFFKIYNGFDMDKVNDSYEDYVTPKKDESYDNDNEPSTNIREGVVVLDNTSNDNEKKTPNNENIEFELKENPKTKQKRDFDENNQENIAKSEEHANKKRQRYREERDVSTSLSSLDSHDSEIRQSKNHPILSLVLETAVTNEYDPNTVLGYADQLTQQSTNHEEYADETITASPEDNGARTEKLSYSDNPETVVVSRNTKFDNIGTKKKDIKLPHTVIPKRDFYTISTPNYLAQLPRVVERYRFDEPIPEKDREQELLKNFGNPPASINGKQIML